MTQVKTRLFALALVILAGCAQPPSRDTAATAPAMDSLVSVDWLGDHLDDPGLVVLDCTVLVEQDEQGNIVTRSARERYEQAHIPGAGFADLEGALSNGRSPLKFALPDPQAFAAAMGALGVGDDTRVVLYDDGGSGWAARVWWMLRWIGVDRAALLDGGLGAWRAAGRPLASGPVAREARSLTPHVRPELIADRDEVLAAIDDDSVWIIDALPEASFRGEFALYGRPGHIPGADNVPAMSLLAEDGRFRSDDELAALFGGAREERAITYCGGGISASVNAFVMHRLGYDDVAVYTNSLQEWAANPDNTMTGVPSLP